MTEARFAQIPEPLIYDPTVDDGMVRVYAVLLRHGTEPEQCHPSHRRIAELTGKSPRTIPAIVGRLADAGWVEVIERKSESGDPDANGYRVHSVPTAGATGTRSDAGGSTRENGEGLRSDAGRVYASERGGSTRQNAPKESNRTRASERDAPAAPSEPQLELLAPDATPTRSEVATSRFEEFFWPVYPRRHGRRANKKQALAHWLKLSVDDQRAAVKGAKAYAAYCESSGSYAKDPDRWLRDRKWEETADTSPVRSSPSVPDWVAALPDGGAVRMSPDQVAEMRRQAAEQLAAYDAQQAADRPLRAVR